MRGWSFRLVHIKKWIISLCVVLCVLWIFGWWKHVDLLGVLKWIEHGHSGHSLPDRAPAKYFPEPVNIWKVNFPLGPLQAYEFAKIKLAFPRQLRIMAIEQLLDADTLDKCYEIGSISDVYFGLRWNGVAEQIMTIITYETISQDNLSQDMQSAWRYNNSLVRTVASKVRSHFLGDKLLPKVLLIGDSMFQHIESRWPKAFYSGARWYKLFALMEMTVGLYVNVVVFHGGTNDIDAFMQSDGEIPPGMLNSTIPNESGRYFLQQFKSRHSNINADRIDNKVKFFFTEVLHRYDYANSTSENIRIEQLINSYNQFLHFASTQLENLTVIPMYSQMQDKPNFSDDGLHPSSNGRSKLVKLIDGYVTKMLK